MVSTKTNKQKDGCITNSKARKEKEGGKQNVCVCGFAMEGGSHPKTSFQAISEKKLLY